jgi:hypothetical protein
MHKVRIVSDGQASGTKVYLEDGSELKNITTLRLEFKPCGPVIARVEVLIINPQLDIVASAVVEEKHV